MLTLYIADAEKDVSMKNLSQKEAIALLRNLEDSLDSYCGLNEEGKTAFRMAIEALNCSEIPNNSDTISRQQAIDALKELTANGTNKGMVFGEDAVHRIEILPSVQPNHCAEVGKKVLIDRQEALEAIGTLQTYKLFAGDDMLLIDQAEAQTELMMLPPAKLKTGHWILDRSGAYCCSKCMEPCAGYVMMKPRDKFCKMCGSRNEVTE